MGVNVKAVVTSVAVCGVLLLAGCSSGTTASTPSVASSAAVPEVSSAAPDPSAPVSSAPAGFYDLPVGVLLTGVQDALSEHASIESDFDWTDPSVKFGEVMSAFERLETSYTLLKASVGTVESQGELGSGAPKLEQLRTYVENVGPYIQAETNYYVAIEKCVQIASKTQQEDCGATAYATLFYKVFDAAGPLLDASDALRGAN